MNFIGMIFNRNVFNIGVSSLILTADNFRLVNETIYTADTIKENEQVVNEIFLLLLQHLRLEINQAKSLLTFQYP